VIGVRVVLSQPDRPGGDSITLNLPDTDGRPCELILTFGEASWLAMTLPRSLTAALRRKYSDGACVTSIHCTNAPWNRR
jgi:hypothetical protein